MARHAGTAEPTRRLVRTAEAAAMLGTTEAALREARCTGRWNVPFVKIGASVRYDLRDIETFIEARRTMPGSREAA